MKTSSDSTNVHLGPSFSPSPSPFKKRSFLGRTCVTKPNTFQYKENDFPDIDQDEDNKDNTNHPSSESTCLQYGANLNWDQPTEEKGSRPDKPCSESKEMDGWTTLTLATSRQALLPTTKVKKNCTREEYLDSLNKMQYSALAKRTFKKVVSVRNRYDKEFIEMHGYEYYTHNYTTRNNETHLEEEPGYWDGV
jgi:hypothetical protein